MSPRAFSDVKRGLLAGIAVAFVSSGCDPAALSVSTTSSTAFPSASAEAGATGKISKVIDGDTVHVMLDGKKQSVRLIGVDTPETVDPRRPDGCYGQEASAFTKSLLPTGTEIRLSYDVERLDRYDRPLAYVYRTGDGLFVNAELVRGGFAVAKEYPPNVAHANEFRQLETQAKAERKGLWGAC